MILNIGNTILKFEPKELQKTETQKE